ncbi:MAG TPA: redoxin family protein [Chthoniobacter sp.]|jgi:mono/diheme cytochrome c family protein
MQFRHVLPALATLCMATGALSPAARADEIADKFAQFDTNHDGVLSGDELNAAPYLRSLDLKGDGKVTLEEARIAIGLWRASGFLKKWTKGNGGATPAPASEPTASASTGAAPALGDGHLVVQWLFKRYDKNGDGKITPDELPDKALFDKLDLNKDGVVTIDEAQKVLGPMIARRGDGHGLPQKTNFTESDMAPLKEEPLLVKGADRGVGRRVDNLTLKNLSGQDVPLVAKKDDKAVVLALFSASCPISNKLGPELARIEKDYASRHVAMFLVNIAPETKPDDVRKFVGSFGLKSPVVNDAGQTLERTLAATTSTEVFVLDASRTLIYRGAVNDQYGLGYSKDAPTKSYLREALDAVVNDTAPPITATSAPGCALDVVAAATKTAPTQLTYHREISRILQANCVECHRDGGIGPFPLDNYDDVIEHAGMIRKQITRGAMPPWFAAKEPGENHLWMNDRSLSDSDKTDLLAWVNSDHPVGNPADAPIARRFDAEWNIGKPDAVFQIPQPIAVKAEGTMPYQHAVVQTSFTEDRWVRGYEIAPTARAVVHHVIVRVHSPGARLEDGGNSSQTFFAAYVPGNSFQVLPEGFARRLPAGSRLSFEIHYTPNGHATQDQLKIGLLFASEPPKYEVHVSSVVKYNLNIPPGEANHVEVAETVVPSNIMLMSFVPHMHVRGKAFKYELITADGKTETLLDIPHYDFNWQLRYEYAEPKFIPAGSKVRITAVFDNSPNNPANPNPNKTVHWGPQTSDEMMIGYVESFTPYTGQKVAQK